MSAALCILLCLFYSGKASSQTITIGDFDPGTNSYGLGGEISVPFTIPVINNCFSGDNKFKLILTKADDSKSFEIGVLDNTHFATYINGTIPDAGITAGVYKLKVVSTNPALEATVSKTINIRTDVAPYDPLINIESDNTMVPYEVFGFCKGKLGNSMVFTNKSSTGAVVSVKITNNASNTVLTNFVFDNVNTPKSQAFPLSYFTAEVTAVKNNVVSTKSYLILNSPVIYSITSQIESNLCYPQMYYTKATGFENNYPGLSYTFKWGDNVEETYTHCQLIKKMQDVEFVEHLYKESSCGRVVQTNGVPVYNAYRPELLVQSRLYNNCEIIPSQTIVRVSIKPKSIMEGKDKYCVGEKVSLINKSEPGDVPGASSSTSCTASTLVDWYVSRDKDNFGLTPNATTETFDTYKFTEPGKYYVKLVAKNAGQVDCSDFVVREVCVSEKPEFDFALAEGTCQNQEITLKNVIANADKLCDASYKWRIKDPSGFVHTETTDPSVIKKNSDITYKFDKLGDYEVELIMGEHNVYCGEVIKKKTIHISEAGAGVSFSKSPVTKCAAGIVDFTPGFGNLDHSVYYTGDVASAIFNWTITPVSTTAYEYIGGTSNTSIYPKIQFKEAGTYTVKVVYKNACGEATAQQVITFAAASLLNKITINNEQNQRICNGDTPAQIIGEQGSGTYTYQWYSSSDNSVYTPFGGITTNPNLQPGAITVGLNKYYKRELIVSGTCKDMSDFVRIIINKKPDVAVQTDRVLCNGESFSTLNFSGSSGSSTVYEWSSSNSAIGLSATTGTASIPAFTTTNTSNKPISSTITVTPKLTEGGLTCSGDVKTFKIYVLPSLSLATISDQTVCGGTIVPQFSPTITNRDVSDGATISYEWQVLQNEGVDLSSTGSGDYIPSFKANNDSNSDETSTIKVTAYYKFQGKECLIGSGNYNVIVKPLTTANAGTDKIIYDDKYTFSANAAKVGETGTWTQLEGPVASFDNIHLHTATVNGLIKGKHYKFQWSINNGTCDPSTSPIVIDVLSDISVAIKADITTVICPETKVNLSITNLTGGDVPPNYVAASYTYEWEYSTPENPNDFQSLSIYTDNTPVYPKKSAYYRLKVKSHDLVIGYSNSVFVQVYPIITNNRITANQTICAGLAPTELKQDPGVLLTGGAGGSLFYRWERKGASETAWTQVGTLVNYQPGILTETTEFRRIIYDNTCSTTTSESNTITITVTQNAKAEFTATKQIACAPFNLKSVISNATQYPDRNNTYEWYAGIQLIGTGPDFPDYSITTAGTSVDIKLVVTSKLGCQEATITKNFKTTRIDIVPKFTSSLSQPCGAATLSFNNTSLYSTNEALSDVSYSWLKDGVEFSTVRNPLPLNLLPSSDNTDAKYVITLKISNGCVEKEFIENVIIRSTPLAMFSPEVKVGCSPFNAKFNNQSRGVDFSRSNNKYTIDFGDGQTQDVYNNLPILHTYTTAVTKTYTVKLTAYNECGNHSVTEEILVHPNNISSDLVVVGLSNAGCAPFAVQFTNNTTGATSYNLNFGDGESASGLTSPQTIAHTFTQPGTYTVVLTTANGCSSTTSTETIVVYEKPEAAFTTVAQACINKVVSFSNTNIKPGITYTWDFGDMQTSTNTSPSHTYTTAGVYTVYLTATKVTNNFACTTTISKQIEILAAPAASFTTNYNSLQTNCAPFNLTVNAISGGAANIQWDFGDPSGDNNFVSGISNPVHQYKTGGTYTIKGRFLNSAGCFTDITRQIIINDVPQAAFDLPIAKVCGHNAGSLNFINKSTFGGTGTVTYEWYIDGVLKSTSSNLMNYNLQLPPSKVLPYNLPVKLVAKSDLLCATEVTYYIEFNPLPQASFQLKNNVNISCSPFKVEIINTSKNASYYEWWMDGVKVSEDPDGKDIFINEANASKLLLLKAFSANGCTMSTSSAQTVKTYPKPSITEFKLKNTLSCDGKLKVELEKLTTSSDVIRYEWDYYGNGSKVDISTSANYNLNYNYTVSGNYNLVLRVYNQYGCSDSKIIPVEVGTAPEASILTNNLEGCTSLTVKFASIINGETEYEWDFGDGISNRYEQNTKSPTRIFPYRKEPYVVTLIAKNGQCESPRREVTITVTPPPTAHFDVLPDTLIQTPNFTFTFSNSSSGDATEFKWIYGDGKISHEKELEHSHTYSGAGEYLVQLIAINNEGCSDTTSRMVTIETIPGSLVVPNAFEPGRVDNPDLSLFKPKGKRIDKYSLKIFNRWGELIWRTDLLNEDGEPIEGWDGTMKGAPAPQGVYIWDISAVFADGTEWKGMKYGNRAPRKSGTVHLIR